MNKKLHKNKLREKTAFRSNYFTVDTFITHVVEIIIENIKNVTIPLIVT